MKYTVYLIRHISTGMVLYVGKTRNFKKRAYQHLSLNSNSKKWLEVVGTSNVIIEEVAKFNNETDALKFEDELILKYCTITNGYNKQRSGLIAIEKPEEYQRCYQREYRQIEEHKEYQRKYHKKDRYKKYQKEYQKEYRNTNKSKEYQKKYQIAYRQSKKLGLTIDEYRRLKNDQGTTLEQNKKQPIQLTINF